MSADDRLSGAAAGRSVPSQVRFANDRRVGAKGWYSRGYLPHYDDLRVIQSVSFRLIDSIPRHLYEGLDAELDAIPESRKQLERRRRVDQWLDAGMGCCALGHPEVAEVMQSSLLKFHGDRYDLLEWSVMPNHVHVLMKPHTALSRIIQSWKAYTGRWALQHNEALSLKIPSGRAFWMPDYWDRYIRDEEHLRNVTRCIRENPVLAGLCKAPEDWRWSSAGYMRETS